MTPRNFSKTYATPYFQTEHYKKETPGGKLESKIEKAFYKLFRGRKRKG